MNELSIRTEEFNKLDQSKAAQIEATFAPMTKMLYSFEEEYKNVVDESRQGIDKAVTAKARKLRLAILKVRTGTKKTKDEQKKYLKLEDKAIMGAYNILVNAVAEKEAELKKIEDHFENVEKERLEKIQAERAEKLFPYVEDAHERNLSTMTDEVWEIYIEKKVKDYDDRIEAERIAAEQKEQEEIIRKERDRRILKLTGFSSYPFYKEIVESHFDEVLALTVKGFDEFVSETQSKANNHDAEQKRIKEEKKAEEQRAEEGRIEAEKIIQAGYDERRKKTEEALIKLGFEVTQDGATKDDILIGCNHYNALESDVELSEFIVDIGKRLKAHKEKAEAEYRANEAERLLKEKEDAERLAAEESEKKRQEELARDDCEKAEALVSELTEIMKKYSFEADEYKAAAVCAFNYINSAIQQFEGYLY